MRRLRTYLAILAAVLLSFIAPIHAGSAGGRLGRQGDVQDSVAVAHSLRGAEEDLCTYAIQLFFLQDISHSYEDDLQNLLLFLPVFLKDLVEEYPQSQFALGTFSDYPMPDVGWSKYEPYDICFKLNSDFTADPDQVVRIVRRVSILSGRDDPEAQLTALHHAAKGPYFRDRADELPEETKDVRLIVLSTDAEYHVAGDLAADLAKHPAWREDPVMETLFPPGVEFTVRPNDGDEHLSCTGSDLEDYPELKQVATALRSKNAGVLFLVPEEQLTHYRELVDFLTGEGVLALVQQIETDSSNILTALSEGLQQVYKLVCLDTTTTSTSTVTSTSSTASKSLDSPSTTIRGSSTPLGLDTTVESAVTEENTGRETVVTGTSEPGMESSTSTSTVPPSGGGPSVGVIVAATAGAAAAAGGVAAAGTMTASAMGSGAASAASAPMTDVPAAATTAERQFEAGVEAAMFA